MSGRRLFELTTHDGYSISPYVWRTKFALAHKKLVYESCGVGFSDIARLGLGIFRTLPILQDEKDWIVDSWAIAAYLDQVYPDQPPIFASPVEYGTQRFFEKWLAAEVVGHLFHICAFDIYNRLRAEDHAYFRRSRESRLGMSLEAAHATREQHLPGLADGLQPLRLTVQEQSFVGGGAPSYADYIAAGALIWAGSVATIELLPKEDALLPWLRRCLDLHGGIGAALTLPGLPT